MIRRAGTDRTLNMDIQIASYNSHGSGISRIETLKELTRVCDNRIPDICAHAVSAIKDNDVLVGRPHGGVACLWRRTLACKVSPLNTNNERLCAIKLENTELTVIIVSVYMPCDTEILDSSSANVFREVLQCISDLCHSEGVDNVIIGGDFNMDFSRNRSVNRQSLLSFMTHENMTCCLYSGVVQLIIRTRVRYLV